MWIALLIILPLLYFFYKWSISTFDVFKERGIPYEKPLPLIGNGLPFITLSAGLHKVMLRYYRDNKQHKICGFFSFRQPLFIVNDPELIKQMAIKDFESFPNHKSIWNAEEDPLLKGLLTVMKDQRWKDMRNTLSPVFTGAKMRTMFTLMNDCFAESMKYLDKHLKDGNSFDIELKDCFCRLSNDIIATTAFGIQVNSYTNENNEFFTIGQSLTKGSGKQAIKLMLFSLAPKLFSLIGLQLFDKKKNDYFIRLVLDTMKYREEHNIVRPDMINLLMEAKRESEHQWSDEDLVAQCFIFFFAAFENNANLLCITCHELMLNPDIQNTLYEEILETHKELNGKTLDYDTIKKMKYLEMVISESLRKWSIAAMTDRECGKDYTVKDEDGKIICELKKGDTISFQIFGLHWDPKYFENPEVFDPERFNEENKKNINPSIYLPFGIGPRICIGNRYALMQAKAMIFYLLLDFKLERSEKTMKKDLLDEGRGFQIAPKAGFWVKLVKREEAKNE